MARKEDNIQQLKLIEFPRSCETKKVPQMPDYSLYQKTAAALVFELEIQCGGELGIHIGTGLEKSCQEAVFSWLCKKWPDLTNRNIKLQFEQVRDDLAHTLYEITG